MGSFPVFLITSANDLIDNVLVVLAINVSVFASCLCSSVTSKRADSAHDDVWRERRKLICEGWRKKKNYREMYSHAMAEVILRSVEHSCSAAQSKFYRHTSVCGRQTVSLVSSRTTLNGLMGESNGFFLSCRRRHKSLLFRSMQTCTDRPIV